MEFLIKEKIKSSWEFLVRVDEYFWGGIALAIATIILGSYAFLILPLLIFILIREEWGDKVLIFISILLYLTFITDILHSLRLYVQIVGFLLLTYIFFKRFGMNFSVIPRLPWSIIVFVTFFYFSMIISTLFSAHFTTGVEQIINQTVFFLIVYFIYSFLDKAEFIRTVLYALGLATIILCLSILYEYALNNFDLINYVKGTQIRISGILSNINASGSYLGAFFPISLVIAPIIINRTKRYFVYIINFILFLGIIFTTSRSAYLSVLVSILFIYYMLNKKRLIKVFATLIFLVLIILVTPQFYDFFSLFFRVESGLSQRTHLWKLSLDIIRDHPFFGIGPGSYSFEMLNYFPVLMSSWVGQELVHLRDVTIGANNSHNFFLFFASDMGIGGLLTSILLPVVFIAIGLKTLKKYIRTNMQLFRLSVGLMAAGLGLFFRGIFESIGLLTYGWITMDLPFWLIFISLISLYMNSFGETKLLKD